MASRTHGARGQKQAFSPMQVTLLRERFSLQRDHRSLALINLAIDSMLRAGDLLALTVQDVLDRPQIVVQQGKTRAPVTCSLLPHTLESVRAYVTAYRLKPEDRLFPMHERTLGQLVKGWARILGLDPREHAAHSLRRTKAVALAEGCSAAQLDQIRVLLGHRWISSTQSYLGTSQRKALDFARSNAI